MLWTPQCVCPKLCPCSRVRIPLEAEARSIQHVQTWHPAKLTGVEGRNLMPVTTRNRRDLHIVRADDRSC